MSNYYIDTEFVEDGRTIMPISLAVVSAGGREFYVELDFDQAKAEAHDFVREQVLPHLRGLPRVSPDAAAASLLEFIGTDFQPQFWAWYGAYDWVLLCQLFGTMMELPKHFPMFVHDLRALCEQRGVPVESLPRQEGQVHDALADARWLRNAHLFVECSRPPETPKPPRQRGPSHSAGS